MSLTKLSLGGNYDVINKLFLPRKSLVSDIPVGTGISKSFFTVYSFDFTEKLAVFAAPYDKLVKLSPLEGE
jgi:hypothetical protein